MYNFIIVRQKEKGIVKEIITVTIGNDGNEKILGRTIAMGADRAIHVKAPNSWETSEMMYTPQQVAKVQSSVYTRIKPDIIFFGKQVCIIYVYAYKV